MGTLLVHGGDVLTPFEVIEGGAVLARDGRIERVGRRAEVVKEPADVEVDVGGRIICPGFVDLQVNGGGGALLTEEPGQEALERMTRAHVKFGTTSMLPTVVTADEETMVAALEAVNAGTADFPAGSRVLGAHLEGPFINPNRKGAHDDHFIEAPRKDLFERLLDAAGGSLRLLTLAPELPGALELVGAARAASVVVAAGHTEATIEEAERAIEAGVSVGTHLLNAMRSIHQREPGVIGALLRSERAVATIIADGVHVHPAWLSLAFRAKGADGIALVTDAMPPVGADSLSFRFRGKEISVREGACYAEDGTLSGSVLSMNRAVRLMSDRAGVPLLEAVRMATATPARVLGLEDELGTLKPGAQADIVVCDRDMTVCKVFVGGELAYDCGGN
jgi:N-acetylglucosamine-6-phosphate deacetylase